MAEAILAGKKVIKLAGEYRFTFPGISYAEFPWFAKHFLMGDRPGDAGNGHRQYKKPDKLGRKLHIDQIG